MKNYKNYTLLEILKNNNEIEKRLKNQINVKKQ